MLKQLIERDSEIRRRTFDAGLYMFVLVCHLISFAFGSISSEYLSVFNTVWP